MALSQRLGWIGVDIGTHTVKLAQAVRDGAEVRLHRAAVIQRLTDWSGDDALALEQPITSLPEIRAALEAGGFSGRNAIVALPMNVCQLRALNIPPGTDRERKTIIADELAEDFAALNRPMEFDFWELDSGRAEKGTEGFNVNVLATSRLWIDQLWRDCRQSGLNCWSVDGGPLAMARAVALAGGGHSGQRVMAVDWGFANTLLSVVGEGRPLYSRRIHDAALGHVLEAIQQVFDVNLDEAQHLAETQGLGVEAVENTHDEAPCDPHIQAAITDAAAAPLEVLVRQIGRTLEFMEGQRRQLHPSAIWLVGGGASVRNIDKYLQHALKLPVHIWRLETDDAPLPWAAGSRAAMFAAATALSASAWRDAA